MSQRVLLIGEGRLAEATARALEACDATVGRLRGPSDTEIRESLDWSSSTSGPAFRRW